MATLENQTPPANGGDKSGGEPAAIIIPPEKRGRGRPPGSGKKAENAEPRPKADPGLDPAIIGDLFVSISEIGDDLWVLVILGKARQKIPAAHFEQFKAEVAKIRLMEKDKNLIRSAAIALAKKYTFLMKWGPEIVLLVAFVQYSARMANLTRSVNALPNLPKEEKQAEPVKAP